MPAEPPSKPDKPAGEAEDWDGFTSTELLAVLEAVLSSPLPDPEMHSEVCARITSELLRRVLLQEPAEGESAAVH